MNIWKKCLTDASHALPDFNDDLLLKFRKRKISEIIDYLDILFKESVKLFDNKLKYVGYKVLSPDERIAYIKSNQILKKKIEIQKSTFNLLAFNFEFEGVIHPLHVHVPYMDRGAIWLGDTQYFPLFPIVERGGLHRTQKDVIIKVMRAPLTFKRSEYYTFVTNKNPTPYRCMVVTVKIHQRKKGRGGKKTDRTPLVLYHLVNLGFYKTMYYYGFKEDEIYITTEIEEENKEYSFIKLADDIYIKVKDTALQDRFKQRVIASFMMCLEEYPKFTYRDLIATHPIYFKTVLGKYTYPTNINAQLLYDNAEKHLETTKTLLDPPAQYQLASIGIIARDIYELLRIVFFEIDNWIVGYDPTNLYTKKIGALDQIMAPLVSSINTKQFGVINSKNEGLNQDVIKRFVTSASQGENWMMSNPMFRANPTMCNDNWLLSIGSKRFRSLENIENKQGGDNKGGRNMPVALLKAHPSQLIVESILALPPSSPIISGEINPFLTIDEDGNIEPNEKLVESIKHVFD